MGNIAEKIAERYADEISGLPSLGTLISFLLVAAAAYMVEHNNLKWVPPIAEIFGNDVTDFLDTKSGVLSRTSLGALLISAGAIFLLKYAYTNFLRKSFTLLAKTKVISRYVAAANEAADLAGLSNNTQTESCTVFLSDELSTQRKIFQRIHGAAFVVFIVAALSILSIINLKSLVILIVCLAGLIWLEYIAIRHYLTKLFPALCVVWAMKGKASVFGDE